MPVNGASKLPESAAWYKLLVRRFTGYDRSLQEPIAFGEREVARCHRAMDPLRSLLGAFIRPALDHGQGPCVAAVRRHRQHGTYTTEGFRRRCGSADRACDGMAGRRSPHATGDLPGQRGQPLRHRCVPIQLPRRALRCAGARLDLPARSDPRSPSAIEPAPQAPHERSAGTAHLPRELRGLGLLRGVLRHGTGALHGPAQALGKWEWDLVRSVRVVLDAGIHGLGWSREEALRYWEKHIPASRNSPTAR
ncbi:MAG: DUF885 family protein [Flavobacteriales bacterium]|nr:DUF885 family protein [Flavobacteriales bacterium]